MTSFVRQSAALFLLIAAFVLLIGPFTSYMREKPLEEKLGYVPSVKALKLLTGDQKELVGAALVMKVLMYYGGVMMKQQENVVVQPPDYRGMSRILHGALELDPYNIDGYYFAQAFLVWDAKQVKVANDLLIRGMKYRTWDWYLPFFAGFNYAYFLKDYPNAAKYYRLAAQLSGQELHVGLTSRYLQEAGQTDNAINYLSLVIKTTRNQTVRNLYQTRLLAFREVREIERARDRFQHDRGRVPQSVEELVMSGYLKRVPRDPYGGKFYLREGKVGTTSNFAFGSKKVEQ